MRVDIDPQSFSPVLKARLSRSAPAGPAGTPLHRLEDGEPTLPDFNAKLNPELRSFEGGPVPEADHLGGIFATMDPSRAGSSWSSGSGPAAYVSR